MMVIAFTEGSELVSLEVERRLKRVLQRLFKKESQIKCIFDNDTPFLRLCEWTVRRLQASCPEKGNCEHRCLCRERPVLCSKPNTVHFCGAFAGKGRYASVGD